VELRGGWGAGGAGEGRGGFLGALLTPGDAVTKTDGIWHLNKKEIINCLTMNLMETQSGYMTTFLPKICF